MGRGHTSATVTNPEADFFNQSVGEVKENLWASDLICEVLRFRITGGVKKKFKEPCTKSEIPPHGSGWIVSNAF
jgi:hypothetical protein